MALGRQGERQTDLMIGWAELPRSPGHAFYDRLQAVLVEAGFDRFAEAQCKPYYAEKRGRPSLPAGRYFRMHLVGYFEGIESERGLEWRCDPNRFSYLLQFSLILVMNIFASCLSSKDISWYGIALFFVDIATL